MKYQYQAINSKGEEILIEFEGEKLGISAQIFNEDENNNIKENYLNLEHKFINYDTEIENKSLNILINYLKTGNTNNKFYVILNNKTNLIYQFDAPINKIDYVISNDIENPEENLFSALLSISW